jgi:hypothetical protein
VAVVEDVPTEAVCNIDLWTDCIAGGLSCTAGGRWCATPDSSPSSSAQPSTPSAALPESRTPAASKSSVTRSTPASRSEYRAHRRSTATPKKAVVSLTTGLEDAERVTVAFLVAVGAAKSGRPTLMFLTKEAVRLALDGIAVGTACDRCARLPELLNRYTAGGQS